jgi:hypothetical protein
MIPQNVGDDLPDDIVLRPGMDSTVLFCGILGTHFVCGTN